ncbi:HNH endonuclease signature motif containing protein [Actinomycetes bacterium KLBMP 9797]
MARQNRNTWRFSVYDHTGCLIQHGRLRRRPSAEDAAFVKARDRTCRAPGCRTPAHRADLDHTVDWAKGGFTVPANLGVLCRRHHRFKDHHGVRLTQPTPGTFVWRTRLGRTYQVKPQPP